MHCFIHSHIVSRASEPPSGLRILGSPTRRKQPPLLAKVVHLFSNARAPPPLALRTTTHVYSEGCQLLLGSVLGCDEGDPVRHEDGVHAALLVRVQEDLHQLCFLLHLQLWTHRKPVHFPRRRARAEQAARSWRTSKQSSLEEGRLETAARKRRVLRHVPGEPNALHFGSSIDAQTVLLYSPNTSANFKLLDAADKLLPN